MREEETVLLISVLHINTKMSNLIGSLVLESTEERGNTEESRRKTIKLETYVYSIEKTTAPDVSLCLSVCWCFTATYI